MGRLKEMDIVFILREGYAVDPTPLSAEGWQLMLQDEDCYIPLYRLKRNLFMLAHTGEIKYDVMEKTFYADADYDPPQT